ncbi:MAG: hypothetical protein GX587_08185, partial [Bacteroidales bacterium]|nr:hypothetical protein [Bacteroidales bacterium]
MKRHKQLPGVRRWFGQDFIDLQQEALNAIEGLLAPFNSCVLKGCEVSGTDPKTINPGLVLFTSGSGTERLSIIAEFAGASGLPSTFVRFLVPEEEEISRLYDDGIVKPIAIHQRAVLTSVEPSTGAYIAIASSGSPVSLRDAIQSNMYRFVTDADKLNWNGKLNASEVSTVPTASKALKLNASAKFPNSVVTEDATHRFATDAEKTDWNGKAAGNHNHTLASLSEKNYDSLTGLPALLVQKTGFALGSVTDLNTLDTPGFYFGASIANSPFAGEIFIDVIKSSAEIVIQVVKKTGAFAIRTRTSSLMGDPVWSAWTKWGSIASSSQKMLYSDGANGADAASFVHVDPTNSRIGIGTNTPQKTLDVVGETRVGSTYKTNFNGNEIQFE